MEIPTIKTLATYYNTPSAGFTANVKDVLIDKACPLDKTGIANFIFEVMEKNPIVFEGKKRIFQRADNSYVIEFYFGKEIANSVGVKLTPVLESGGRIYKLEEIKI